MSPPQTPFVPAKAGIQGRKLVLAALGPRFRGDERSTA
jgi:hypothetical protein